MNPRSKSTRKSRVTSSNSKSPNDSAQFDVAIGLDQATLNGMLASFFAAAPSLFDYTFTIGQAGITTIEVQIQQAPTLSLTPPQKHNQEARKLLASLKFAKRTGLTIQDLTAGMMTATFPDVVCTINGGKAPTTVPAVVTAPAQVSAGAYLNLGLGDLTFVVANDPILSALLNNQLGPYLLSYLNQYLLDKISIPMLELAGVTFQTPAVTTETSPAGNYLVVYTGINAVALPDPGTAWPAGAIFVGVDAAALNAVANNELPHPNGSGGIDTPNLSWDYQVTLSAQVELNPGAGNSLTVNLGVAGSAGITWHTPNWLPNIGASASISGTASATAALVAAPSGPNQLIQVIIQSAGDFDLSLSVDGLPGWILGPLTDALLDAIGAAVSTVLQNFPFTVYTLAPIPISIGSVALNLVLQNIQLSQFAGPDSLPLALVTANASFVPAPSVTVRKKSTSTKRRGILRAKPVPSAP